jgi:hypothetical protein
VSSRGATAALATALALALTATACAGPRKPFELGLKEVPSDLLLGSQAKPAPPLPAQLPPTAFLVSDLAGGPSPNRPVDTLPPPIPEPPPPPPACPVADPLAPVQRQTALDVLTPPAPAVYTYRTSGALIDRRGSQNLAPTATHRVDNIATAPAGDFTFDVTVTQGERVTPTTYHVVPRTATNPLPGLYIARVGAFAPKPELLLLPFPALRGTTFNGAGSDGLTSIQYDGVVDPVERVDACGRPVDGIVVRLTNGRATSGRNEDGTAVAETFEAAYVIATQYGGLSVRDFFKGGSPAGLAARELHSTIGQVPQDPAP